MIGVDLKQLHYFTEIVRQGNISKAAESLHMAQPPLSQALRKLELELNTTLIERYRSKWAVTESGQYLFEQAENLTIQVEHIKQKVAEIENGEAGKLSIGVSTACAQLCVPIITEYKKRFPKVFLNIILEDSYRLEEMLRKDEIECAVMIKPSYDEKYHVTALKKEPLMALVSDEWVDRKRKRITMQELAKFPFIKMGKMEGYNVNELILDTFTKSGVFLEVELQCRDIGLVQSLVKEKLGFAIIPRIQVEALQGIHMLGVENLDLFVEPVIISRQDRKFSVKMTQLIQCI